MECAEVLSRISAFIDNELDPALYRQVAEHVRDCGGCRKELEALRSVDAMVEGLPRYDMDPAFAGQVASMVLGMRETMERAGFLHRVWNRVSGFFDEFLCLLDPVPCRGPRMLEEFDDVPESFIGHAYFRLL